MSAALPRRAAQFPRQPLKYGRAPDYNLPGGPYITPVDYRPSELWDGGLRSHLIRPFTETVRSAVWNVEFWAPFGIGGNG